MELKNKVAIVTGASKGIGKATALALAKEGAHLAICARDKKHLDNVSNEIKSKNVDVFSFAGDISNEQDIISFIKKVHEKFGRIDILINNAGLGIFKPVSELSTQDWDKMFNLNVRGLYLATRECLPHLRAAQESVVVNVASLAAKNAFVNGGGYAASKHAVLGFSRCLMLEERKNGVRVLAICPGSVATNFFDEHHGQVDPKRKRILQSANVADSIIHMIKQPQHAMVSEIDIRPSNP